MYSIKREIMLLAELSEPEIRCSVLHGSAVPLHKKPVRFVPFIAQPQCFRVLFFLVFLEHIHDLFRELQGTLRLPRLCGIGVDSLLCVIVGSAADTDDLVLEVDVLPFQSYLEQSTNIRQSAVQICLYCRKLY